jgi:hypothetical protein
VLTFLDQSEEPGAHRETRQGYRALWQEDVVLIRAASLQEARGKAQDRGERAQASYATESGETITWTFERVVGRRRRRGA